MNETNHGMPAAPPPADRSWFKVSVAIALFLGAGNIVGYLLYRGGRQAPPPVQDSASSTRALASERRAKAVEALRAEDYARAITNLEAAAQLDPSLSDVPTLLEVARKLRDDAAVKSATKGGAPADSPPQELAPAAVVEREAAPPVELAQRTETRPREAPRRDTRARVVERPRTPEPAPPKVEAPAILLITTTPPKLLVQVDGRARDLTPARVELGPGAHSVSIVDGERVLLTREVSLEPGEVSAWKESFPPPAEERPKAAVAAPGIEADRQLDLVGLIDREGAPKETRVAAAITPPAVKETGAAVEGPRLLPPPTGGPARVLIFWPGKPAASLERAMGGSLAGCEVRVVGRAPELKELVERESFDALLSSQAVLRQYGLRAQLLGQGAAPVRYLGASFRAGLTREQLPGLSLAAVDELGKKQTPALVASLLGTDKGLRLRRVAKVEDLASSLQLKLAEAIVLKESELQEVKSKTRQTLHLIELLPRTAEAVAAGFVPGGRQAVVERALQAMDAGARAELGVERWSRP